MKSGISAVTSVIKASRTGKSAAEIYLQELEPIIAKFKMLRVPTVNPDAAIFLIEVIRATRP